MVRAWEQGGLFAPGWNEHGLQRHWINVVAHNAAVASLVWRFICNAYIEAQIIGVEGVSTRDVVTAALVHDAFKRREFEMIEAAKARGDQNLLDTQHATELASSAFLRSLGFNDSVILMAGTTGDTGLSRTLEGSATIAQELVFYADGCVSGDKVVGYRQRFDDLLPHFQVGGRYAWVDAEFMKKHGKTHRQMYNSGVLPLQEKLAKLARFDGNPNDLHLIRPTPLVP